MGHSCLFRLARRLGLTVWYKTSHFIIHTISVINFGIFCDQVFVGARLHVTGGALKGGRAVNWEAAVAGNGLGFFLIVTLKINLV